jgi:hypothetical protein
MRLREAKRRDRIERETIDGQGARYRTVVRALEKSSRAKVPNTNEWRFVQAKRAREQHWARRRKGARTPLLVLGTFLHQIAPYTDPNATMSITDQRRAGLAPWAILPQYARIHTALPGVPQHQLEAAWVHVEARLGRIQTNNARSRATSTWLGRWSRVLEAELVRRARWFEFPRADHLALIERRERKRFAEVRAAQAVVEFEQMEPAAPMWPEGF